LLRKLLREPLLHFLLLGALLFALYNVVSGWRGGTDRRIVINDDTVGALVQGFQGLWQRPPTPQELKGLIEGRIRDEVLYREGVAMNLDRDDDVIRRRVLQKLDIISEESASQQAPSDAALESWLRAHAASYAHPAVFDFEQVLFDPARHGARLKSELDAALVQLRAGADPGKLGDQTMLPMRVSATPLDVVARDFGEPFAQALEKLPVGQWQGPVSSGYGAHLVRVTRLVPGSPAALNEVRSSVERDFESDRRARAREDYYRRLRQDYKVVLEAQLPAGARPGPDE
jgi:parvulin-like peptidyl-prolyl cis-trans isomerase-like protein